MIDLTRSTEPVPTVHGAERDPGTTWQKSPEPAIDAPPDDDLRPAPEARWPRQAARSGLCGSVSPRVVRLADGTYRTYYTQILPRAGNPTGANDYDNATTRILSVHSADGVTWNPDAGVRLSPADGGAGDFRVVSSEVGPAADGSGRLRMYYECCPGSQGVQNSIRSAISDDGLSWEPEPGERLLVAGANIMAPRILFLGDRRLRMYVTQRGVGIVSAISADGMTFELEPGPRFPGDVSTFAPDLGRAPGRPVPDLLRRRRGRPADAARRRAAPDDRPVRRRAHLGAGGGAGALARRHLGPGEVLRDVRVSVARRRRSGPRLRDGL